jgi:hypothetical protein
MHHHTTEHPSGIPIVQQRDDSLDSVNPTQRIADSSAHCAPASINRRGFLMNTVVSVASLASATAIASPEAVEAAAARDAELLALGLQLEAMVQEYRARQMLDAKRRAIGRAACEVAGLPEKRDTDFISWKEWERYCDKRQVVMLATDEEWARELEEEKLTKVGVWDRLNDRLYSLCERILTMRAATLAGLTVQARASSLSEIHLWEDKEDYSEPWCERQRAFIEAVCSFCGVETVAAEQEAAA